MDEFELLLDLHICAIVAAACWWGLGWLYRRSGGSCSEYGVPGDWNPYKSVWPIYADIKVGEIVLSKGGKEYFLRKSVRISADDEVAFGISDIWYEEGAGMRGYRMRKPDRMQIVRDDGVEMTIPEGDFFSFPEGSYIVTVAVIEKWGESRTSKVKVVVE